MAFIIGLALALIFLEWPWPLIVAIPLALLELFEISLWLRWRNVRSITGKESWVGSTGRAGTKLDPEGYVKVRGQIWRAVSTEHVDRHSPIRVVAIDGLKLKVEPAPEVYPVGAAEDATRAPGP